MDKPVMIHLVKLAVGVRDISHLEEIQRQRAMAEPPLRHRTRNLPRRVVELREGGSLYWVIGGVISARQRLLNVIEDHWDDGSRCAGLILDPTLVRVRMRSMKPFQGWRYLAPDDTPADLPSGTDASADLPAELVRELRALALI